MSITIDYFFNSEVPLSVLTSQINHVLGCSLSSYDGNPEDLFCRVLGMELSLNGDHGFERDHGLNFEDYRFLLCTRTAVPDGNLRPIQLEFMALAAFVLHQRLSVHSGMLTFDVQRLLAQYELVEDNWVDHVSGKPVRFPDHLFDLRTQIADRDWPAA